jgi:hypothetical protein
MSIKGFSSHRYFSILNFNNTLKTKISYFDLDKENLCLIINGTLDEMKLWDSYLKNLQKWDWWNYENRFQIIEHYCIILPKNYKDFEYIIKKKIIKEKQDKFKKIFYEIL